jgi:TRAP-type C4-dicarboxylate transport system substrate-binding protein
MLFVSPAYAKTFKIATVSPDGLSWMKQLRAATKEIEKKTEGRVKFKIYPGGVQGDDFTVLRKMRIGQLHGGAVAASSLTRFYPDLQVYSLPLTFRSAEEVDFVRQRMDQRIVEGLEDNGIISFALTETGFAYLLSSKRVQSLEDLQNMKSWIPDGDPIASRLIQSFGVSPIPLYISDVLAGLQSGLVDAVMVPPIVALALQWHNHVKYMVDLPIVYTYSMLMLDKKAFNTLSDADQAVVSSVMNRVFSEIDEQNRAENQQALSVLMNQGIEVTHPNDSQLATWREQALKSIKELVDRDQLSQESVDLLLRFLEESRTETNDVARRE